MPPSTRRVSTQAPLSRDSCYSCASRTRASASRRSRATVVVLPNGKGPSLDPFSVYSDMDHHHRQYRCCPVFRSYHCSSMYSRRVATWSSYRWTSSRCKTSSAGRRLSVRLSYRATLTAQSRTSFSAISLSSSVFCYLQGRKCAGTASSVVSLAP